MSEILALGLGAVLALVALMALLQAAIRSPAVGSALLVAGVVLSAALEEDLPDATIAGFRVSLEDVIFTLLATAAVGRFLRLRYAPKASAWLFALVAVALFSLLRGALAYGLAPAANEFRIFLRFIGALGYAASFSWDEGMLHTVFRVYLVGAAGLLAVCAVRWLSLFAGVDVGVLTATYDTPIRVLNGPQTFYLGQGLTLLLPFVLSRSKAAAATARPAVVLLLAVLVLNRRTVWLAGLIALGVLLLRNPPLRARVAGIVGSVILGVVALSALPSGPLASVIASEAPEGEELAQSPFETGTLDWRINGWRVLLFEDGPEGPMEWLFGEPFGAGYRRRLEGNILVEASPHNYYLQLLLRVGLVGLASVLVMAGRALWTLTQRAKQQHLWREREALVAALAALLVWFVTWVPGVEQGLLIGVAVGLTGFRATRRQRSPALSGA